MAKSPVTATMSKPRCTATNTDGEACPFYRRDGAPEGDGHCLSHAAAAGDPDAIAIRTAHGQAGGAKNRDPNREACSLRSVSDLLAELERLLLDGDQLPNSANTIKARVGIVQAAHAILESDVLEKENADLRKLLAEKHPDLAKQLRVVK